MSTRTTHDTDRLPGRFEELVRLMPPQAIVDDESYDNTVEMVDRLMANGRLTKGQALYLETLTQLVEHYDAEHYAIDTSGLSGLDSLKHLLGENAMSATDLAKLLGVHASMGSKLLKGERQLTAGHMRKLGDHFKVDPSLFM